MSTFTHSNGNGNTTPTSSGKLRKRINSRTSIDNVTMNISNPVMNDSNLSVGDVQRLEDLHSHLISVSNRMIGFPENQNFDYSILDRFMKISINNCGDPFGDSHYGVNTFEFEKEVIAEVSILSGADPSDTWG